MDGGAAPADSPRARGPGREVGGYRLLSRLGSGGMGTVYAALDADERRVAIKLLHPAFSADPAARERLRREVASLHRVRGPRVARVLDAEADADEAFVVTELVEGLTLEESIRDEGPFVPVDLYPLAAGLADALASIHAVGVVHRDLKPGNVMVTHDGPVLIDFGIAQVADDVRLTSTGFVTGTPGYLDPAVMAGDDVGEAGDWFGWAAVLLYAATGRPPFGRGPMGAVVARVAAGQADTSGLSPALGAAFARALDPTPSLRPAPSALLAALEDSALGREPTVVVREVGSGAVTAVLPPGAAEAGSADDAATSVLPPVAPGRTDGLDGDAGVEPGDGRADRGADDVAPTRVGWVVPPPPAAATESPVPPASPEPWAGRPGAEPEASPTGRTSGRWLPEQWPPETSAQFWPPPDQPMPGWAVPASARPGLVVAGWLIAIAVAAVWPGGAVVGVIAGLVLLGAVGIAAAAIRERRLRHGVRRSDVVRASVASPWYAVRALVAALPGVLLGGVAAGATWWLATAMAGSDGLAAVRDALGAETLDALARALACGLGVLVAWWTPTSVQARSGARSVWAVLAPSRRAARIWLAVVALVVVAAGISVLTGAEPLWAPLPEPPRPEL